MRSYCAGHLQCFTQHVRGASVNWNVLHSRLVGATTDTVGVTNIFVGYKVPWNFLNSF
jgi:hypothetical protein